METLHSKSLLDGEDFDADINKPKDFPTDAKFITDKRDILKKTVSTTTTATKDGQIDGSIDHVRDNSSISNCHENDAKENGVLTLNGNCEDTHRLVDSSTTSACSKKGPALETVSDGLTNIAIHEGGEKDGVLASEGGVREQNGDSRQISVVRLSTNGDISESEREGESECASNELASRATEEQDPSPPEPPPPPEARQQWCSAASLSTTLVSDGISYVRYENESQMPDIMRLITKDLSEPYSIYTYRYFIHNWPKLCFLAMDEDTCVGAIVCKVG